MVDTLSDAKVTHVGHSSTPSGAREAEATTGLPDRLLEAFFSRPLLCLLPLILLAGLGVYSLRASNDEYRASGVITVSNTSLLANLTEVGPDQGFSFETPAAITSRAINDLLGTDEFTQDVADRAGVESGVLPFEEFLDVVRSSVDARATGTNLVEVGATADDPEVSTSLADATIESFREYVVESDVSQSTTAESFFGDLAGQYKAEAESARRALETYLLSNPASVDQLRPPQEESAITRLEAETLVAEERFDKALSDQQSAQLATQQARIDIEQRLRLVDAPGEAELLTTSRRDQAMSLAMYVIAGLLLSSGLVALRAFLDRSVHSANDIRLATGLDALAVVPEVRR